MTWTRKAAAAAALTVLAAVPAACGQGAGGITGDDDGTGVEHPDSGNDPAQAPDDVRPRGGAGDFAE